MSQLSFPIWAVYRHLENRLTLAEAVGFPEVLRLGRTRAALRRALERNLKRLVEGAPLAGLYRRHLSAAPQLDMERLLLDPPAVAALWREPLPLVFHLLWWAHPSRNVVAYLPALGIEVIAEDFDELKKRLPVEIRSALSRSQSAAALQKLVALQRVGKLTFERHAVPVTLPSAKQRALHAQKEAQKTPSVLKQVATDLTRAAPEPTVGLEPVVEQLAELLTARQPRSVILIGPSGVGKTAALRELVRRRFELNLGATPFWATSGARLVAGMSGYGMWQERCRQVIREAAKRRAVLHLGNLVELMEVGKSEGNATGIAAFLRPSLARGEVLAVAECTPEQVPLIERQDPHLLDVFHRLTVPEPDEALGRRILRFAAVNAPPQVRKPLTDETLDTLDRLHRRYATYSAYPGRPLRFLHNLLSDRASAPSLTPADVLAAFTRETGLPRVLLDPEARLDLDDTRRWFEERVLGQPEPVELVVHLLATVKAGLTRPRKPIASLLFIGPTGVGKTEMAKALAEFLFGSRQRLTRFDMSEFGDPVSVQRLVGGVFGSEGLLTAKVREQPFSVLLLDEFEKAHPQFLDLLLQMLGEGRLTDAAGRLADFSNTVVILTSNLGAESYQQGRFGFAGQGGDGAVRDAAREHFVSAVQSYVRPELFNRIDRLVPFAPLGADVIRGIAERHLKRLEGRDGIRYRGVTATYGEGVADRLARNGFDARYGARPLLRTVERELLAPMAEQMNRYGADTALSVQVRLDGDALAVKVRPRVDENNRVTAAGTEAPLLDAAAKCVEMRRDVQALGRSRSVRMLHNDLFQREREQELFDKAQRNYARRMAKLANAPEEVRRRLMPRQPRVTAADQRRMAELSRLRAIATRYDELTEGSHVIEEEALQALYARVGVPTVPPETLLAEVEPLRRKWYDLLLTLYCRDFANPDAVTLALFAEERPALWMLAMLYCDIADARDYRAELWAYELPTGARREAAPKPPEPSEPTNEDEPPASFWRQEKAKDATREVLIRHATKREPERELLTRRPIKEPGAFLEAEPPPRVLGLALRLSGPAALARFMPEAGLHFFRAAKQQEGGRCLVETSEGPVAQYVPTEELTRRGGIGTQGRRRTYDLVQEVVEDDALKTKLPLLSRTLADVTDEAINERMQRNLKGLLAE
jgi:ATP-dependent Clp protease ATP-binding subunit ClpA